MRYRESLSEIPLIFKIHLGWKKDIIVAINLNAYGMITDMLEKIVKSKTLETPENVMLDKVRKG
jgi:hypothetical protein